MIYLNGECRAIYPRLSRGHDFAGLFSTLGIKEVFKMALERPGNFITKFWWDSLTVLSYIEMVYNSKQENPSWNCFWIYGWVLLTFFKYHQQGCFNDPIFSNLGLHAACWALVMCHHELCPTLVSEPVQLSYTVAAPWLYKKNGLWLLNEEDFSWNCYTGTLSFDGRYNSCKTGYQTISSIGTLSWKKFSLT